MLKKLKDFYKRNRVYSILMLISLTCVVAIIIGVLVYFLGQTSKDKYGDRLVGIKNVKMTEKKVSDIEEKISENELVNSVDIDIKGKLIYIIITLNTGTHADAEAIGQASLDFLDEKEKAFYDIQYIVSNKDKKIEENFPIMGYLKKGNSVIRWTNYVQ